MSKLIEQVWVDLHEELRKFIFSKVKDMSTSEDILQDVFVKIQLNIHTLSNHSKLTSWVYQITRNTVADYYRRHKALPGMSYYELAEEETEEPLYQRLSNCVNQKIQKLPKKYKQVLLLAYHQDYSQIGLAEKLNLSYSGAKTRVQRGREKLKNLIRGCKNVQMNGKGELAGYTNGLP